MENEAGRREDLLLTWLFESTEGDPAPTMSTRTAARDLCLSAKVASTAAASLVDHGLAQFARPNRLSLTMRGIMRAEELFSDPW